ncbi:hypothetical protein [Gracilinema caldarium]|uniref:Uncharacterized protein n=1 Tax=Gracilinema caldarium (strain ATCC 51460 / DSM 7334 / H1) TaxID=744872 RepID=F8F0U1_GRAC1|nr:hypothetical protein [Gracilinema caldarium]AEJ20227.1 hypothetical protein Spica_2102 [Gracilinema caldarium DSM 7334]
MVVHRCWVINWLVVFVALLTCCSKGNVKLVIPAALRPEPIISLSYAEVQDDTPLPHWYEVTHEGYRSISDPSNSQVVPFAPWTTAPRLIGFVASGSSVIAGVNRDGFLLFDESSLGTVSNGTNINDKTIEQDKSERTLIVYRIADETRFTSCSALAIVLIPRSELGLDQGPSMPTMLIARDPYFIDITTGSIAEASSLVPAEPFVALDLNDCSLKGARPLAFGPIGTNIEALNRGADGLWYIKTTRFGTSGQAIQEVNSTSLKQYRSFSNFTHESNHIDRGTYQTALNPQPFTDMPTIVQGLMQSFTDSKRRIHFPILQLLQPEQATHEQFIADPTIKNQAFLVSGENEIITFYGFSDETRAVVILPDGRGVIRRSKVEPFALPPLAEGFVYTGIVMLPHWIIASWEEQESFAVGAAGFLIVPL